MLTLRIAAGVEAASLVILLLNLFTAHLSAITSLGGPVHGMAYLVTIAATFLVPAPPSARWLAVIPGIGGLLALRRISVVHQR
ncbi:hypothetical protein [Saccharopolyspora sp. NPDC050642]|uniref:hypothetical protein n=1 Tax=Saccharopolyspora sp. NPDC050642 TaxID=3157099 RepID=UPI0033CD931D